MRLSWNEIRVRAKSFADEWSDAAYEKGETQSFYNALFHVFGKTRRAVATYEEAVKKLDNRQGFIDLFWRGTLLVEQKSAGRDLIKARAQAFEYIEGLKDTDKPRYVLLSDFQNFDLINLSTREETSFKLAELHKHVEKFGFIIGVEKRSFKDQDPVNIKAAELVGKLHDEIEASGFTGHDLEVFLVRLVFCLFADDTGVFPAKDMFLEYLETRTSEDGTDMRGKLSGLFEILNTPETARNKNEDEDLLAFPYINGSLFEENTRIPPFTSAMRESLISASRFDWSPISPAIFGSLFQSVMNAKERRAKGAHYTTEKNIMKVIGPLFLDALKAEFAHAKTLTRGKNNALDKFIDKLASLTFFDPACGCGNFLIIAYREIRTLETEALKVRLGKVQLELDAKILSIVDVDQFYGIELEEFPARIAETAMWMMDHIMNNELSLAFGQNFARIPLEAAPHIHCGDALELDWTEVLAPKDCSYILGNPPFIGQSYQSKFQRTQMARIIDAKSKRAGSLDYVTAWFLKAGAYMNLAGTNPPHIGFVSTNSITQGEQVAQLWPLLFERYKLEISFAHRTFEWGSDARGKAHVHCVIIGLSHRVNAPEWKHLFSYENIKGEPNETQHKWLSPYLFDASGMKNRHITVKKFNKPVTPRDRLIRGVQPTDGGNYLFDEKEKDKFILAEPNSMVLFKPFIGAREYLQGKKRWILDLRSISPAQLKNLPKVMERIQLVRQHRLESKKEATRKFSNFPTMLEGKTIPKNSYLVFPEVTSERREYLPLGWLQSPTIPSNKIRFIADTKVYYLSLHISAMHMAWMRTVTGRMKSDYMYSIGVVYNTFPWPDLSDKAKDILTKTGQAILDARAAWPDASLADLYDPDTMPPNLRKAHIANDKAVDKLYLADKKGSKKFDSERERVEHLFALYETLTAPMLAAATPKKRRGRTRKVKL